MAMSTQVILLSLFILADSYLFALDVFDGHEHHRIPLDLPNPFNFYPGMFEPPKLPAYRDPIIERYKPPFISDFTTSRTKSKEPEYKVTTTEAPPPQKDEIEENIGAEDPDIERQVFLMKNAKVPEVTEAPTTEKQVLSEVNTLSIHDDPKISVTVSEIDTSTETSVETTTSGVTSKREQDANYANNPSATINNDYMLLPVNAVNPSTLNASPIANTYIPLSSFSTNNNNIVLDSSNRGQSLPPNFINLGSNVNAVPNNQPNVVNSGAPGNVFTIVTIPNNPNQPNTFNVQPNNPQIVNLVPVNNLPTGTNQPGLFAIINNQLVPLNTQPNNNNFPINNQPNNLVTVNGQSFNLVPINNPNNVGPYNNQPINVVPINNQPNNFVPQNNQPNYFVPVNSQPNNFVPVNNQPINLIPVNNQPNTLIPVNNQPNNFVPLNNQPNNVIPLNNQPYNVIPVNSAPNNLISLNNQPNNYIPANLVPVNTNPNNNQPNNNFISIVQPIDNSNSNLPNNVPTLTAVSTVGNTRDEDVDSDNKKEVEINNGRDEE